MKTLLIIILLSLQSCFAYSQSDWFWQNPLPQGNNLYGLNVFDENNALCISRNNILKTDDGGENWNLFYTGFQNENMLVSMLDENTGLMIIDPNIIIKTTNGGSNWNYFSEAEGIRYPSSFGFISSDIGFIFSFYQNSFKGSQIQRTSNGGSYWTIVYSDTNLAIYDAFFPNQTTGYAIGSGYLGIGNNHKFKFFKTTDSGIHWDTVANSIMLKPTSLYFINENTGYVGGSTRNILGKIYQTTNGGMNWDSLSGNPDSFGVTIQLQFFNFSTGFALTNSLGGIYKTTNSGAHWNQLNNPSVNLFEFLNSNIAYGVGAGGLITKSYNGGNNWINQAGEINNLYLDDIKFSDNSTGFAVGSNGVILKTINQGSNWSQTQFDNLELTSISKLDSYNWFVSGFNPGKIYKTTNIGLTWDTLNADLYGITKIEFLNALTGYGVCKYLYFFKTTDGGQSWIVNSNFNTGQNYSLDFIDENTGYTGGNMTRKTTNGGLSWVNINFEEDFYSSDIQFVNYNTGFISSFRIVGGVNYYEGILLKTTNAGLNWQTTILGNSPLWDLNFLNERIGFTLNGNDVFKTTNGGDNWFSIETCSSNYFTSIYYTDSLNGYIAGNYGTIIKTTNGGGEPVSVEPTMTEVPMDFTLSQNYPNPFNPKTIISYELRSSNYITLKVYDLLGKEIITLVNQKKEPGMYEVAFDGSNLSSGIYFYRIEAGDAATRSDQNFVQSRKMILLK